MPARLQSCQTFFKAIVVILLVLSSQLLSQPMAVAVIGDKAEVSPGKIPYPAPKNDTDHYLGNSTFRDGVNVQLEYPRSFILQETVGDLVFKLNLRQPTNRTDIYIPPEFKVNTGKGYVWSTINNSYAQIGISKLSGSDKIAPNWYDVSVTNGGNATRPATRDPKSSHVTYGTIWYGNHTIRVFNATAPSIVGRYFFKVYTNGTSIGVVNFPSVVVSADPNPAYVSGFVRYGGHVNSSGYDGDPAASYYGHPIGSRDPATHLLNGLLKGAEGGRVMAMGVTPEGRIVVGQAFFNSTSSNYTLYGLAAGRYRLNATAAGFSPVELSYNVMLKSGQSLTGVDIFLERSPSLSVQVLSRRMGEPEPWGVYYVAGEKRNKNVTLEILDYTNLTVVSRIAEEAAGPEKTDYMFNYNGSKDLDGHIPQEAAGYVAGISTGAYCLRVWVNGYIQPSALNEYVLRRDCAVSFSQNEQHMRVDLPLEKTGILTVTVHFLNSTQTRLSYVLFSGTLRVEAYDIDDELRASNSTSVKVGPYDATVELTGPSGIGKGYGLSPGTYTIKATFSGYVQEPDEHKITIGGGNSSTSLHMLLTGRLNLAVFSVNWQRPPTAIPWRYPDSTITVEIRNAYGLEVRKTVKDMQPRNVKPCAVNFTDVTGFDDGTGNPSVTYSIYVFTCGYYQEEPVFFSVGRCGIADISVSVKEGVRIGVTLVFEKQRILDSIDTYKTDWIFDWSRVPVRFEIYDSRAQFVGANTTYVNSKAVVFSSTIVGFRSYSSSPVATRWANYYDTTDGSGQKDYGLKPDLYTVKVFVPGYYQQSDPTLDLRTVRSVNATIVLQRMGHLSGTVLAFNTMYEKNMRISWISVDVLGQDTTLRTCTLDGFYELWVNPGSYLMIFSLPDYQTKSLRMQVTEGSDIPRNLELLPFEMSIRSHLQLLALPSVRFHTGFDLSVLELAQPEGGLSKE
jgi:hypothetical protein